MINFKKIPIILITLMSSITLLIGCGNKTEIGKNDFINKMKESGFQIADATEQAKKGEVESITVAANDKYQIEFFEMNNEDDAVNAYNVNQANIEDKKGSISSNSSVQIGNYSKYSLNTKEKYYCVSRIGRTFIYVEVPLEYEDTVKDYLDKLGY